MERFYKKLDINPNKLYKLLNWIEIKETPKKIRQVKDSGLVFLYVGWLIEEKGIQELVEIIVENEVLKKHTFIFAGSGTLFEDINNYIKNNNIKI